MLDRVPTKPNRYAVYDDAHNFLRYEYHERADEPTQVGDALNKANLLPDAVATVLGLTGNPQVGDALAKLSKAAMTSNEHPISSVAAGTEFTLNETIGGTTSPATFVKLKNDYEGSGRVLVVRKEPITDIKWNSVMASAYSGSTLDSYLNSTYIGYLDAKIQDVLQNISIPYTIGNGSSTLSTILRKCFALSAAEYGLSNQDANVEGSTNYASSLKIAYNGASAVEHWTRTPHKSATNYAYSITSTGELYPSPVGSSGVKARPAFTLPSDFKIAIPTMNSLTDVLGNDFPLPYAQIATGSYTGTGTFGSGNKNSLTFGFTPKKISIISSTGIVFGELIINGSAVYGYSYSGSYAALTGSISGDTISWFAGDADKQLNASGVTYIYVAEG